jgi:hypothetical protein
LQEKLCSTVAEAKRKTGFSKLADIDVDDAKIPPVKLEACRPALQIWLDKYAANKDLIYATEEAHQAGLTGGEDSDDADPNPMIEAAPAADPADEFGVEDSDGSDSDDEPLTNYVTYNTNRWCKKNKPKRGESKEDYRLRVEKILKAGKEARDDVAKEGKAKLNLDRSVAAGQAYDKAMGTKKRGKPSKIVEKKTTGGCVLYLCMWKKAKGYEGVDTREWVSESDALGWWNDAVKDYESQARMDEEDSISWQVDKIVAKRYNTQSSAVEYQVQWKSTYGKKWPSTWEPVTNLDDCRSKLTQFNENSQKRKRSTDAGPSQAPKKKRFYFRILTYHARTRTGVWCSVQPVFYVHTPRPEWETHLYDYN